MKKLILHVGYPKTGTYSLQDNLELLDIINADKEKLKAYNYL